ncbi:MAG: DHA2 family efflux MFS transporter permease subunit [Acidiferrobacter sp.]
MAASAPRPRKMGALTRVKDSGGPAAQNFWAVALVVAFAAFMEVLDLTIVNVSLLHIMGSMAVSQDKAIWVLTAYTMTNAIILPLSGWLATRLGRKRYFMGCIAAFSVTSLLCGLSPNFSTLVIFRALQGIAGGGLQPNAQAILTDAAPAAKRGMAFAVYGMAVVFAPAIGPTVGGWITDHIGWRWIFLINVPIGLLLLPLVQALVYDPESFAQARSAQLASSRRADFAGFALITLGLGLMQVVLDRGQQDGWFASPPIVTMTITWILALAVFVVREWRRADPIVDLRLLRDPGFAAGNVLMFMLGALLLGSTALLPLFMQSLLGYTAVDAGLVLSPGGLVIMALMPVVGQLISRLDARVLIASGLCVSGFATLLMTHFDTHTGFATLVWTRAIQAAGLAFLFIPINTLAFSSLPATKSSNASAIINMSRNIGGSVGMSIAATILARRAQYHQSQLVQRVTPYNSDVHTYLAAVQNAIGHPAPMAALAHLYMVVVRQSEMLAYIDDFELMGILFFACLPLVLLFRRGRPAVDGK